MKLPDHRRYHYSPLPERQDYHWPDQRRLALYVCVAAECFAFGAGVGEDFAVVGAPQTQRNFSWRDYGLRVGLWRLLAMLDELRIPVTLAVNGMLPSAMPELAARLRSRQDQIVCYGRTSSESTASMWEEDEAEAIQQATSALQGFFGEAQQGWASPGVVESPHTLDLLAQQGYRYVLDWPADDQPFWLTTNSGRLLSIPFPLDSGDITIVAHRRQSGRELADVVVNQCEQMLLQSEDRPLVLPLMLHPYVAGQPFRLGPLRRALEHCLERGRDKIWMTRPGQIMDYCSAMPQGVIP